MRAHHIARRAGCRNLPAGAPQLRLPEISQNFGQHFVGIFLGFGGHGARSRRIGVFVRVRQYCRTLAWHGGPGRPATHIFTRQPVAPPAITEHKSSLGALPEPALGNSLKTAPLLEPDAVAVLQLIQPDRSSTQETHFAQFPSRGGSGWLPRAVDAAPAAASPFNISTLLSAIPRPDSPDNLRVSVASQVIRRAVSHTVERRPRHGVLIRGRGWTVRLQPGGRLALHVQQLQPPLHSDLRSLNAARNANFL